MHRTFNTDKLLHTCFFSSRSFYRRSFYMLLHTEAFTHSKFLYTEAFTHTHTHTLSFTQRSFYTQKLLHPEAFTHRRFRGFHVHNSGRNCNSKPDLGAKAKQGRFWSTCFKKNEKENDWRGFWGKSTDKSPSKPRCSLDAPSPMPFTMPSCKIRSRNTKEPSSTIFLRDLLRQVAMYLRTWQHNMTTITCSYSNANCNHTFRNTKELRTGEQT